MVPLRTEPLRQDAPWARREIDGEAMPLINHIRLVALGCRAASKADFFEACALLATDPHVAREAAAETLIKCFSQATGKRPKILRPGVAEVSFDEAWIGRLALAASRGDEDSFRFLIQSRVPRPAQRNFAFLVRAIVDQFSLT